MLVKTAVPWGVENTPSIHNCPATRSVTQPPNCWVVKCSLQRKATVHVVVYWYVMCCAVLCCAVLCCAAVLCCVVLCCVLCCAVWLFKTSKETNIEMYSHFAHENKSFVLTSLFEWFPRLLALVFSILKPFSQDRRDEKTKLRLSYVVILYAYIWRFCFLRLTSYIVVYVYANCVWKTIYVVRTFFRLALFFFQIKLEKCKKRKYLQWV